ncbi:MAG: putative glycosyltransferase [Solirubrobacterales bacterium]|nr:putative glycosyltransferase [Solirubrobacterales bacterium]
MPDANGTPNGTPLVSIVIVTHNNEDLVTRCLDAVVESSSTHCSQIIVVDNASTDGTIEVVEQGGWPVDVISLNENVGFARAVNHAWKRAEGRYVALINSDAFPDAGCIDELVSALEQRSRAGIVGAKLRYPSGRLQPSAGTFPSLMGDLWVALFLHRVPGLSRLGIGYLADQHLYLRPRRVDWVSAAVCASRSEVGPLPTSSFMYGEDVEWASACRDVGWEVWLEPAASAVHVGRASVDQSQDAGFAQRQRVQFELAWFAPRGQAVQLAARFGLLTHALLRLGFCGARRILWRNQDPRAAEYAALLRAALSVQRATR